MSKRVCQSGDTIEIDAASFTLSVEGITAMAAISPQ